jgi:hypothetical protein
MRQEWARHFTAKAESYWTEERTRALVGDKGLLLLPATAPVLLRALGLLNGDASMPPDRVRKYRQINHMLAVIRPALHELAERFDTVHLVDAGCGRSYLTMLVAWFFGQQGKPVRILGIDRNIAFIRQCRRRAEAAGLKQLRFAAADLALDLQAVWDEAFGQPLGQLHGMFSLHACDTATDDALALAVAHDAAFIAVAPCCQAELAAAWADLIRNDPDLNNQDLNNQDHALAPLWASPHLRRSAAATLTDTFRLLLLRACGYEASAIEFVESVHTAKNTLIRAMRRDDRAAAQAAAQEYRALRRATGGVGIGLENRLGDVGDATS